ncbi:MAG: hypothetical protein QXU18_08660 [Thermoplasmatales archaeon]
MEEHWRKEKARHKVEKRENGKLKIMKEIYIGDVETPASIIENPMEESELKALDFGTIALTIMVEKDLDLKEIVSNTISIRDTGLYPATMFCCSP